MKNILIILFTLLSINLFGQIKPSLTVEGGYISQTVAIDYFQNQRVETTINNTTFNHEVLSQHRIQSDIYKYNYYTSIVMDVKWKSFTLTQHINHFMTNTTTSFKPKQVIYITSLEYKYKDIIIGYEHMCNHPIISDTRQIVTDKYLRSSYDKISVKIKLF